MRYFSRALLFVTCRAQITPLQIGISIGNPHWREKTDVLTFRLPSGSLDGRVPALATALNAVSSAGADAHPIWR